MANMDIIFTVSFKFIDSCDEAELHQNWNTEGYDVIELLPEHLNTQNVFVLAVQKAVWNIERFNLGPAVIREGIEMVAMKWFEDHRKDLKVLQDREESIWFSVNSVWRLQETPWMFPRPKKLKDERARLHVQFN